MLLFIGTLSVLITAASSSLVRDIPQLPLFQWLFFIMSFRSVNYSHWLRSCSSSYHTKRWKLATRRYTVKVSIKYALDGHFSKSCFVWFRQVPKPQLDVSSLAVKSFLKADLGHPWGGFQSSGDEAYSGVQSVRLAARVAICQILNYQDHFPMVGSFLFQLVSSVYNRLFLKTQGSFMTHPLLNGFLIVGFTRSATEYIYTRASRSNSWWYCTRHCRSRCEWERTNCGHSRVIQCANFCRQQFSAC